MPPFKGFVPKNKNKIFYQKGRKSEGKRGCAEGCGNVVNPLGFPYFHLSLIHISEPTRRTPISYAVFCLKKKKKNKSKKKVCV